MTTPQQNEQFRRLADKQRSVDAKLARWFGIPANFWQAAGMLPLPASTETSRIPALLVSVQEWVDGLRGKTGKALDWARILVKALIEQGGMTCPAFAELGAHKGAEDEPEHQRADRGEEAGFAVGLLDQRTFVRLAAIEQALTVTLVEIDNKDVEVRAQTSGGKLVSPPRVQFLREAEVVVELTGRLENDEGRILVTDQDLANALSKGATRIRILS